MDTSYNITLSQFKLDGSIWTKNKEYQNDTNTTDTIIAEDKVIIDNSINPVDVTISATNSYKKGRSNDRPFT